MCFRPADEDNKIQPRPKGFRPLYDIPFMFEAREFLRKKLIDKKVHVVVDYIQEARDNYPEKVCATVTIGGVYVLIINSFIDLICNLNCSNVAETLVSKGLATVVKYRQDDDQRSSHYDELMAAESKAAKSLKGLHAKKDQSTVRVHEINVNTIKYNHFFVFYY